MLNKQVRISIKVRPNAGKTAVMGQTGAIWRINISAPPDKGKANKAVIEFISKILGLKKDNISIIKGQTSHNKIIAIEGMSKSEIDRRLSQSDIK